MSKGETKQIEQIDDGNEDVIQKSIGILGKWHIYICLLMCAAKFPVAWQQIGIVFLTPPMNFTCSDPIFDKCSDDCPSHEFDRSVFTETIITEWDLVCEKGYLANLSQSITMFGILFGNMVFGYLSDRFGRQKPLLWGVIIQLVTGLACSFTPWFPVFSILRFLVATATGGTMIITFVVIMEIVGKKWRTVLGILYHIPFNIGHMLLAFFGYLMRDWKYYNIAISAPSAILIVLYLFVPESPRWLLSKGRKEEALQVLEKAAKVNKLPTEGIKDNIDQYYKQMKQGENENKSEEVKVFDLVKTPIIRKYTICLSYNWFSCGLCFYGVAQYISRLGGDIFINVAISGFLSIPGCLFAIYSTKAWGRKKSLIILNCFSGIPCILAGFVPTDPAWLQPSLACIGMFGLMASFGVVYIYSGEVFPTVVRNTGVGSCSMCARIGSILAPFVATLNTLEQWIPAVVFGVIPVIGAMLCVFLPETLDCKLPDTIEEAEEFEQRQKK